MTAWQPKIPILQSPIGGASVPELCSSVSLAGALGGMALTWTEPDTARAKVRQVRAATQAPFYVNFALIQDPESLAPALEEGAPIVTFSWGDPSGLIDFVHASGAIAGVQVSNADGAKRALDQGADFLICQGSEAGGHVQSTTLLHDLLHAILREAQAVPVVASGGIATPQAIAQALRAGAWAVAMGTRFLATQESAAHPDYKALLTTANSQDTALTICFDGGWPHAPHRVLRNSTLNQWEAAGSPRPGRRPGESDVVAHNARGEAIFRYDDTQPLRGVTGDIEAMCLYAGAGCGFIEDIPEAGELVVRLWTETEKLLEA